MRFLFLCPFRKVPPWGRGGEKRKGGGGVCGEEGSGGGGVVEINKNFSRCFES